VEILKSAVCSSRGPLYFLKIFVCCSHLAAVVVGVIKWLESLREFECLRSSGKGCDFSVCVCVFWECSGMGRGVGMGLLWHYSGTTLVLIWYYSGTDLVLL